MSGMECMINLIKGVCAGSVLLLFLTGGAIGSFAQKSAVLDAFSRHNIDTAMLRAENVKLPDDLSFDLKETTITTAKTDVIVAKFDHKQPRADQWIVVSVNGTPPSKGDTRSFRKNHDDEKASILYDDETYKIEEESADHLVISYKQHPSSNSKDAVYMKDCRLYMMVNLKTKRLDQVQVLNEKPIRIKVIIQAEKFDLVTKYAWHEASEQYVTANRTLNLTASVLGERAVVQTISDYSNYS